MATNENKVSALPSDEAPLRVSKKRARRKVEIEDEDGAIKEYYLVEMNGTVRDRWLGQMSARLKTDSAGKPTGVRNFEGLQASLIAACLTLSDGITPIGDQEIQKWPSSTQKTLFEACQEMNGLTVEAAQAAKND